LCHAENPEAVTAFVESCRYPFNTIGLGDDLGDGRRGGGGQASGAEIWGVSVAEYLQMADPWPLNPKGELLLGLKIENKRALANAESSARVSGISFAEWGPGDMGMSLGHPDSHDPPYPLDMQAARGRIKLACEAAGLSFLHAASPETVEELIDEGIKFIGAGRDGEETAIRGREYTNRQMPV
jgi:4-hydroxy-2-oxoheptanedioate aldolase